MLSLRRISLDVLCCLRCRSTTFLVLFFSQQLDKSPPQVGTALTLAKQVIGYFALSVDQRNPYLRVRQNLLI